MISVTVYRPDGAFHYPDIKGVKAHDGVLEFDYQPDSTSLGYTRITTTCPFSMEEKFESRNF
jgi:hypothetical protein